MCYIIMKFPIWQKTDISDTLNTLLGVHTYIIQVACQKYILTPIYSI